MKNNKNTFKILSTVLSLLILAGATSALVYAQTSVNKKGSSKSTAPTSNTTTKSTSLKTKSDGNLIKDETVYVLSDTDGSVKKVMVSDWLKNTAGEKSIKDYTELKNIENLKNDAAYSLSTDNKCVWDAAGDDIYYQGTTEKKLPIEISISYTLDGKPIAAKDLAGKSGKVTMHFDYKNTQHETVKIDDKNEEVYVPFVTVTGMILDNEHFSNIKISNGKVINDNDRSVVMGFALPGIQESLGISKDKFELPNSLDITADVTDFALSTTLTVVTNDMLNELNFDDVNTLDELNDSMNKLSTASKELMDGSSALYTGLSTLLSKSGELISGIDQLTIGANKLNTGATSLNDGTRKLQGGLNDLSNGLNTLVSNNDTLNGGAYTVFQTLLSTANTQLAAAGIDVPTLTIDNYSTVLSNILGSLSQDTIYQFAYNKALETVTAAVNAQKSVIRANVETTVHSEVLKGVLAAVGNPMTAEEYEAAVAAGQIPGEMQSQISAAVDSQMSSLEIQGQIESITQEQIESIISQKMQSEEVLAQINAALSQAATGENSITALKSQIDSYNQFYMGLKEYTSGVSQAYQGSSLLIDGINQLSDGSEQLSTGSNDLCTGLNALKSGSSSLIDGVTQLKEGSMQLSDGMKEFNDTGIQKLVDVFDGDIKCLVNRLNPILDVSKKYQNFAGKTDEMNGTVKFIYKTDSIE